MFKMFTASITFLFISMLSCVQASVIMKVIGDSVTDAIDVWNNLIGWSMQNLGDMSEKLDDCSRMNICVILIMITIFFYLYYKINMQPLNWVRNLGDTGYVYDSHENKIFVANQIQKLRKVGNLPPVYPNGWYGIIESHRLPIKTARSVNLLGKTFAVFRDEDGEAHILDAYCPHNGANLGVGGEVKGKCIECPFHSWRFDGNTGKCVNIPYLQGNSIPSSAKVHSYCVSEVNGWIHLWFDAENREPTWNIPIIEQISQSKWIYRGRTEHNINCHIEEIPENGADVAHLDTVHSPSLLGGTDLRLCKNRFWSFGKHKWEAVWAALPEPEAHIAEMKLVHSFEIFGFCPSILKINITARQIGPALVHLMFENTLGNGVLLQSISPTEPLMQRLTHNIYASRLIPNIFAKLFMIGEALQVERDLMIWNNKCYMTKPVFVRSTEDTLISKHRRWYSQFYSENSPKLHSAQSDTMEW